EPTTDPTIDWFVVPNSRAHVEQMQLDLAIVIDREPIHLQSNGPTVPRDLRLEMIYRNQSLLSQSALLFVEQRLRAYFEQQLGSRGPFVPPIQVTHRPVTASGTGGLSLAAL